MTHGVWLRPFRDLVYTMPPYVCTDDDIAAICTAIRGGGERRMSRWEEWLRQRGRAAGPRRAAPRPAPPARADDAVVDLAGNDYLGLSRHPAVTAAAAEAARTWGAAPGRPGW